MTPTIHDLVIHGAGPTGLSIAIEALRAGLDVLVVDAGRAPVPVDAVARYHIPARLDVRLGPLETTSTGVSVRIGDDFVTARAGVVIDEPPPTRAPMTLPPTLAARVHLGALPADIGGHAVLVVGAGDAAAALAFAAVDHHARVVVSLTCREGALSTLARSHLHDLEHERKLTVLWRSPLDHIEDVDGYPMVFWDDRRTPDLLFDHVVLSPLDTIPGPDRAPGEAIVHVSQVAGAHDPLGPARAWETISVALAELLPPLRVVPGTPGPDEGREIHELQRAHYNATITSFEYSHEDLWVLRVRPDQGGTSHRAGQYATLGLGYWEPRVDDADEALSDKKRTSLIRRSYSISSRMLDEVGYVVDPHDEDEIEFYIVHVRPSGDQIPALTPRLAAKRSGDRIYLGPKVTGRYTLGAVNDPDLDVVFLATGTGEAPHNAMLAELLRKRHRGGIVSVVTVRHLRDLGYLDTHRRIEGIADNYRYMVLPTREPGVEKRYIQSLVESGELAEMLPHHLDPDRTHVYLCGNPAMIGLPEYAEDGTPVFPPGGVAGLLAERGFVVDRRGAPGNVHYEEYW
jgi:ferredoxin/flavodoxin---NADP+ reductase